MNTELRKTVIIPLANNRKIELLFIRPTPTGTWVCQASDECLSDMVLALA